MEETKNFLFDNKMNIFTVCLIYLDSLRDKTISSYLGTVKKLEEYLKRYKIRFYGYKNNTFDFHISYILANINLSLCKCIFKPENLDVKSFEFLNIEEDGSIVFHHFKQNSQGDFIEDRNSDKLVDKNSVDEYFKCYDIPIPFDIFKSAVRLMSNNLESNYGWNNNYIEVLKHTSLAENRTLGYLYRYVNSSLLTKQQEESRLKKLDKIHKEIGYNLFI